MKIPNILFLASIILLGLFTVSCEEEKVVRSFYEEADGEGLNESISEYIESRTDTFSRFHKLMKQGKLHWTLTAYNPNGNDYTMFLPTDEAVNRFIENNINYGSFQELMDDKEYVKTLVRYHVVNQSLRRNDFPYGALPDTTLSGDYLTITYTDDLDSTILKVNNIAGIIQPDISLNNGYVHIIDEMLRPVVFNSYEWLSNQPEYSIFTKALEITGLKDTFNLENGSTGSRYPANTLLVESDEVFDNYGINSIEDLKNEYSPDRTNYKSPKNGLYQFVAYHILEGKVFLNNMQGTASNYNTYGDLPVAINGNNLDIRINTGAQNFDTLITENDTTIRNYIKLNYDASNVRTKNGAVHFITDVMEPFTPDLRNRTFQFYEEPLIYEASQVPGTYQFDGEDINKFSVVQWDDVEIMTYIKSSSGIEAWNNDFLEIEGDFQISYQVPKILPGKYTLEIRANDQNINNATIQVYLDGQRIGGNIDLTSDANEYGAYSNYTVGVVNFVNYKKHDLRIETLVPGKFTWDAVNFNVANN